MNILHVFSGGLDSTALLCKLLGDGHCVHTVHFQYGSKHNKQELESIKEICAIMQLPEPMIVNLGFIDKVFCSSLLSSGESIPEGHYEEESMKSTVVPFRNGIFTSIAIGIAESHGYDCVTLAVHQGDHAIYPDCRKDFFQPMSEASFAGTYSHVLVDTPFIDFDKSEIVKIGDSYATPFGSTWTCYKGGFRHCGVCGACTERKEAFVNAGVVDPTIYAK